MHYYYLYGQNIMSDIEIPRLIRKKEHDFMPDIKIMCGDFYGEYKKELVKKDIGIYRSQNGMVSGFR